MKYCSISQTKICFINKIILFIKKNFMKINYPSTKFLDLSQNSAKFSMVSLQCSSSKFFGIKMKVQRFAWF